MGDLAYDVQLLTLDVSFLIIIEILNVCFQCEIALEMSRRWSLHQRVLELCLDVDLA